MQLYEIVYLLCIPLLIAAEVLFARNQLTRARYERWFNNVTVGLINEAIRYSSPVVVSALLIYAGSLTLDDASAGLTLTGALFAFLLLDFFAYWLHRINHYVHLLWRLHRLHHSDVDVDFSTTFRHHPGEYVVSLVVILAVMLVFRLSPAEIIPYVIAHRFVEIFSHSNIRLNPRLDACLALVIVTPRVHQIHHSAARPETDSNFGQVLTWWDRLFGTFTSPGRVSRPARFGLERFRSVEDERLVALLSQPFK